MSVLPQSAMTVLLLLTGLSSGAMTVSFAFAKESVPGRLAGTASGVVNMGTMMGPMLLQPAIVWVLDYRWEGAWADRVRLYSARAYQIGFSLIIASGALGPCAAHFYPRNTLPPDRIAVAPP